MLLFIEERVINREDELNPQLMAIDAVTSCQAVGLQATVFLRSATDSGRRKR